MIRLLHIRRRPRSSWLLILLLGVVASLVRTPCSLAEAQGGSYIRLTREKGRPLAMEVAIRRFEHPERKSSVTLVSAIHIAEKTYYSSLNTRFRSFDHVLYELVAARGTRPTTEEVSQSELYHLVSTLQDPLHLVHQLDAIDYQAANFVHADLSFTELLAKDQARSDTQLPLTLRLLQDIVLMSDSLADPVTPEIAAFEALPESLQVMRLVSLLSDPAQLKVFLAALLVESEHAGVLVPGAHLFRFLVEDRNKEVMRVVEQYLERGSAELAVFYGAGHMPDLEQRLETAGFSVASTEWITAWDLTSARESTSTLSKIIKGLQSRGRDETEATHAASPTR